jgi:hypothetical protein
MAFDLETVKPVKNVIEKEN